MDATGGAPELPPPHEARNPLIRTKLASPRRVPVFMAWPSVLSEVPLLLAPSGTGQPRSRREFSTSVTQTSEYSSSIPIYYFRHTWITVFAFNQVKLKLGIINAVGKLGRKRGKFTVMGGSGR